MPHLNNVPQRRWQPLNCCLKQPFPLSSCAASFRTFSTIRGFPVIPNSEIIVASVGRDFNATVLLPQNHKCGINRDSCEPGTETGSLLEVLQVNESFHEGILKDILCILPILYDPVCPAQNLFGVACAEFNKGNSVPRPCSRDQQCVAHLV